MRIIKAHIGLIKYIVKELMTKKTPKQYVYFVFQTARAYFRFWVTELKNILKLIDPEFRKQQTQYHKYNEIKGDLQRALKMLKYLDMKMTKAGVNRQKRRQFWHDFIKNGEVRKEMFEDLMKEIK